MAGAILPSAAVVGRLMIRRLRLASGLLLLAYVTTHLLNHAVGLFGLPPMGAVRNVFVAVWSSWPLQILLYGSLLLHFVLALLALWQRRSLRLRGEELAQLILGFAVPILLTQHVVGVRLAHALFGTDSGYYRNLLWIYFVESPLDGVIMAFGLVFAWGHAMIGLHFWLRIRPWYDRIAAAGLVTAILVPLLALLGLLEGGREVLMLSEDPAWTRQMLAQLRLPSPEERAFLVDLVLWQRLGVVGAILGVLAGRVCRRWWQRRHGVVRIGYPDGRRVEVTRGTSVLEASRLAGIPHASVCGGRGRCSTCRVRVRSGHHALTPPDDEEAKVLKRIGATAQTRLACQLRPRGDCDVVPLLPPFAHARDAARRADVSQGTERDIAILFADIRGFTALSEGRLPYDVVFILNRYFAAMGRAVEKAGGRVDKFIGDGVMALFGIDGDAQAGCRSALVAARQMSQRLDALNQSLRDELDQPLRIGIGIHVGPVIVGELGYGSAVQLTAIGDAVNIASRLETLTKEYACELVVSDDLVARAGLDLHAVPAHEIEVRGRRQPLVVRTLARARDLPDAAMTPDDGRNAIRKGREAARFDA